MNYYPRYQSNPQFPYPKKALHKPNSCTSAKNTVKTQKNTEPFKQIQQKNSRQESKNAFFDKAFDSLSTVLDPIEKLLGRKIQFDDILLVVLIYIIFTEKDNDNNTLLLALVFILLG